MPYPINYWNNMLSLYQKTLIMKHLVILLLITSATINTVAQVSITNDGSTPDASAMLDIKSTEKGLLIPRMSKTNRNAIVSPAQGLLIFQTDCQKGFYFYDGCSWTFLENSIYSVKRINDLEDGRSDYDGSNNGSSIYLGLDAGRNDDLTDNKNTAMGYHAMYINSSGFNNVATGYKALLSNRNGYNNTAIGYYSLYNNKYGDSNTAIGKNSLAENRLGNNNVAVGKSAGYSSRGNNNIFIGNEAGYNETGNNKLYIENSDSNTPLIYGDFDTDKLIINGSMAVTSGLTTDNIIISDKLSAPDSGSADMKAYIYGGVLNNGTRISDASSGGFLVQKLCTGKYKVRFIHSPGSANKYIVLASTSSSLTNVGISKSADYFEVYCRNLYSGCLEDRGFDFVVYKK